jgi:hypothetical protein
MKETFYVSYSKLDSYKSCPMKYKYAYIDKLEPKVKSRSLVIGSHIHKLIEQFYLQRNPELLAKRVAPDNLSWRDYLMQVIKPEYEKLDEDNKKELGENYINDLIKIIGQYEFYYTNDKLEIVDLENKKQCYLGKYNNKDVTLTYICDGVVKVGDREFLMEHKSYKTEPMTYENTWMNLQTSIYVDKLNNLEGHHIDSVLWDNIKSVAPAKPNILKSGAYGKQAGNVTMFSFISCDTIMQGLDAVVNAYKELLNNPDIVALEIENNYTNFLSRHTTTFNKVALNNILEDSNTIIDTITNDKVKYYRNMGWTCNGCPFKDFCKKDMCGE